MNDLRLFRVRRFPKAAAAFVAVVVWGTVLRTGAAQEASAPLWHPLRSGDAQLVGPLSCASASCHGSAGRPAAARISHQESQLFAELDPHAQAARTLDSPRFREIVERLTGGDADAAPALVRERCAKCHDPLSLERSAAPVALRGIGCETCHGNAEHWVARHYEQGITKQELAALGMIDTDNLLVRGRLCASCHVGDEERDVNHDLFAAGHPPLRFELSAYHDLLASKHWSDAERISVPQFKAQLWLAGQLASADASLALSQARARKAVESQEGAVTWPEFAEFDCLSCHQRLRPLTAATGERGKAASTRPRMPAWQPWNLAMAQRLLKEPPGTEPTLATAPGELLQHATLLRTQIRQCSPSFTAEELLQLVEQTPSEPENWSVACQELLALKAAYLGVRDNRVRLSAEPVDQASERRDLEDLTAALRFGSRDSEWPAFDWAGRPKSQRLGEPKYSSLPEIRDKVRELAGELREELLRPSSIEPVTAVQP